MPAANASAAPPSGAESGTGDQCRRMAEEGAGLRQIARVLKCSPATVRKALASNTQAPEVLARDALLAENGHVPGPAASGPVQLMGSTSMETCDRDRAIAFSKQWA